MCSVPLSAGKKPLHLPFSSYPVITIHETLMTSNNVNKNSKSAHFCRVSGLEHSDNSQKQASIKQCVQGPDNRLDDQNFVVPFPVEARYLSPLQSVQLMQTGVSFLGDKNPRFEAKRSPPSTAQETGRWVGSRASLDGFQKSRPCRDYFAVVSLYFIPTSLF